MSGEFQPMPPKPDFAKLRLEASQCRAEGAIAAAFRCYRILQEEYPGEICSWTECLDLLYHHMRKRKQVSMRDRFRVGTPREIFERAMELCTTEEDRIRLEEKWNRFWEEAAENLRRGNWILEWFGNREEIFSPGERPLPNPSGDGRGLQNRLSECRVVSGAFSALRGRLARKRLALVRAGRGGNRRNFLCVGAADLLVFPYRAGNSRIFGAGSDG